jgi:SAM-dependent methyltransferase
MTTPRLYSDLAHLWPMLSPVEHYEAEADVLRGLIGAHFDDVGETILSLLELGVGGGHTLVHLADEYECTAVDLSETMLANCRALIPQAELVIGDMRSVRLNKAFDVVFIHDAIDYMLSEDDVRRTLETVAVHLKPGGLCVIAPTYTRETFIDGDVADDGTTTDSEELTYFTYIHDPDPADDTFEMILLYLIRDLETRKVELVEDRHTCGLFSEEQWVAWMRDAGFEARQLDADTKGEPWTLFVGVKSGKTGNRESRK